MPTIPRLNTFEIVFPNYSVTGVQNGPGTATALPLAPMGGVVLSIPDSSLDLYITAGSLAGIASSVVSLATSLQTIIEPTGGVRVKDLLDPYNYQIVTQALTANGLPTPPGTPAATVTPNPLGGAMAVTGTLTGLAAAAGVASSQATSAVTSFVSGSIGTGTAVFVGTGFPDYAGPISAINASLSVIGTALSTMATLVNASVDVPSRSLALRAVLGLFQVSLNQQSAGIAGRVAPTPTTI